MHIFLQNLASVQLPVALFTHQQFCVKYYYSQSSFRTPPVPSVFEDNPVSRRRRRRERARSTAAAAENDPCQFWPLSDISLSAAAEPPERAVGQT